MSKTGERHVVTGWGGWFPELMSEQRGGRREGVSVSESLESNPTEWVDLGTQRVWGLERRDWRLPRFFFVCFNCCLFACFLAICCLVVVFRSIAILC